MVYRPTVRYADEFKNYVDEVFYATKLDRNQILRLALFTAAHSKEFIYILKQYQRKLDVPLPSPKWGPNSYGLWRSNKPETVEGGRDVTYAQLRTGEKTRIDSQPNPSSRTGGNEYGTPNEGVWRKGERREGKIRIEGSGGIRIKF